MPPLFLLEPYEPCVQKLWQYYFVTFALVSDTPSQLLDLIQEYSSFKVTHFNHTILQHGVCIESRNNTNSDIKETLEFHLNETIFSKYNLKTKVLKYYGKDEDTKIDTGDVIVAVIILGILFLNVIGSFYDVCRNEKNGTGLNILLCFSIRQNWRKLMTPVGKSDPRLERLKSINGIRTLSTSLVIMSHAFLPALIYIDNPQAVEETYNNVANHIFSNGSIIMQTFFTISGFLLVYNLQIAAEKNSYEWLTLPRGVLLRWLRLTPAYALVLAVTVTWMRHAGSGPLWQPVVGTEARDCARNWWLHLVLLNNYVDGSECMVHTWYLAADFHLYILGIIVFVSCRTTRARVVSLSLLFNLGLITSALHTYFQDLDAAVIFSPETIRWTFKNDRTYNHVYKRSHTNISCYVLGLALGYIVYYAQKTNFDVQKYKKYRMLLWSAFPVGLLLILSASLFYADRGSMPLRMAYAALARPLDGLLLACYIFSSVLKYEDVYRGVVEWRGWTVPGRLSFSAYLLHASFVRYAAGVQTIITHSTKLHMVQLFLFFLMVSYLAAFVFWIVVEAPLGQLVKVTFERRRRTKNIDEKPEKMIE
ncbi:nose resistant to fluoxetine protein 6-like [Manduca sexta]|uniref:nose resistant to fluoxetine protein 6-like n=1 Tax=Manduca sexta TaxID=7130 RepID=UPI00188EA6BA|nr:nose resistant to fluoxetine protein 6-like [Manduca sexta]